MEELYQQITQRFERVRQVGKGPITSEVFRTLKDEEKVRCEKQTFILSMMRANKSSQIISKNLYFKYSFEMMRKINPEFTHEINLQRLDENFLNDFVGLYRHFFQKYEEVFNFKLKLQNLIRPTNHNLIIDLVRYLIDFSRDYYQQTIFWFMKSTSKIEKIQEEESKDLEEIVVVQKQELSPKKATRSSLNEIVFQRSISKKSALEESQLNCLKKDPTKNYQILDITGFPPISSQTKDNTTNIQVLKIRINDFYRELKSRNIVTKTNINNYYSRYFGENYDPKQKDYIEAQNQSMNRALHPFRLVLNIQKNGFNFISVLYSDSKTYSRAKDKRLSPLKISQRLIPAIQVKAKPEFMLTSLKVIRISQNFLPPIINQSNVPNTVINSTTTSFPYIQPSIRSNLMSSSSATNDQQIDRKAKKQSYYQIAESSGTIVDQKMAKEKSYRKLNELKRSFKSEQKRQGGILLNSNNINTNSANDPQKKIFDWLQKLRQVKQIERKKIMGLS